MIFYFSYNVGKSTTLKKPTTIKLRVTEISLQSQKIEEFEQIVQESPDEIRQEKTVIVTQDTGGTRQKERMHQVQVQKPCRKQTAPRFVSPVTGMIVDQGADIVLEGIVDGNLYLITFFN